MPEGSQEIRDRARVRLRSLLLQNLVAFGLRGFHILDFHPREAKHAETGTGAKGLRILPAGWYLIVTGGQCSLVRGQASRLGRGSPRPPWLRDTIFLRHRHRPLIAGPSTGLWELPLFPCLCCGEMDLPKMQLSKSFLCKKLSFGCPSKSKPLMGCIRPFLGPLTLPSLNQPCSLNRPN